MVSPVTETLVRLGWQVEGTGGGCEALAYAFEDGSFFWLTAAEDPSIPERVDEPVDLGLYPDDRDGPCEPTTFWPAVSLSEALMIVRKRDGKRVPRWWSRR
jgi:hypothetical protein